MFNVQDPRAPFQMIPPELLAQIAQGAFRPPQLPQAPQMGMPQHQDGMGSLGSGLAGFGLGLGTLVNANGNSNPEANVSGFAVGGGPKGPSGGALAPTPPAETTDFWGFLPSWLRGK